MNPPFFTEYAGSVGKMKRICSIFLVLVLAFTVTGCGLDMSKKSDKVSIVTTMFAAYDFARQVAGDRSDITLLLNSLLSTNILIT